MLSVIVVDYKSLDTTIEYIRIANKHLINCDDIHYIIIDNYRNRSQSEIISQFGTSKVEQHEINDIRYFLVTLPDYIIAYVPIGKNLGYAKGNNLGIRLSDQLFHDQYYLISNNDIEFPQELDILSITKIFEENKSIGVLGPRIVGVDMLPQSPCKIPNAYQSLIKKYLSMATHNTIHWKDDLDASDNSKFCYRVMGSFMFLRASSVWEAGLFDENTFMYAEEMILSERLSTKGYKTYYYNDFYVLHKHGETVNRYINIINALKWSFDSEYYYFKTYRKTHPIILLMGKITKTIYVFLYRLKHKNCR